jgi:hypothetical protein
MATNFTVEDALTWDKKPIIKMGTTIENIQYTPDCVSKALVVQLSKTCLDFINEKEHALFKKSYRIEKLVPIEHP